MACGSSFPFPTLGIGSILGSRKELRSSLPLPVGHDHHAVLYQLPQPINGRLGPTLDRSPECRRPRRRAELLQGCKIPLVERGFVSAHLNTLQGVRINAWDSEMWNIGEWRRSR